MKVRITLTEEALGSAPSNEELLATYIASKAPTSELSAEEIDNIKAQNAEDRITVFYKSADGTPFQYNYQVKGMFKDSCQMLAKAGKAGYSGGKACAALKAYKKAIDGLIFVYPREIHYDTHGLKMATASALCGRRHRWVSASALPKAKPCRKAAPLNLRLNALTRNWKIWCVNA